MADNVLLLLAKSWYTSYKKGKKLNKTDTFQLTGLHRDSIFSDVQSSILTVFNIFYLTDKFVQIFEPINKNVSVTQSVDNIA